VRADASAGAIAPRDTVQVRHWADDLLPEAKRRLGIDSGEHDGELLAIGRTVEAQIGLLTGHDWSSRSASIEIKPGALPFAELPDLQVSSASTTPAAWPIPDPVHPDVAMIMQLAPPVTVPDHAAPKAEALKVAGWLVAECATRGLLLDAIWRLLAEVRERGDLKEFFRGLLDPEHQVHVPVVGAVVDGWWLQISRQLSILTKDTPDDHRLIEVLTPPDGQPGALIAYEPRLIIARLTEHPAKWAMPVRIWITDDSLTTRAWRMRGFADTIHRYGIPILTIDTDSTAAEAAAQLLLAAHWHGYLEGDEAAIPPALAAAFPKEVASVRHGTGAPDSDSAAALLFERLLRPGFDPRRSAAMMRRYVRRHAATIVRARWAQENPGQWVKLGISERYYYRLVSKYAAKNLEGKYDVDHDALEMIRAHLKQRDDRAAAIELLRVRGFTPAAARKAMQRHPRDWLKTAQPRRPHPPVR
jgi:hypothetical protein